jgi:cytidine deaminase
MTKQQINIDFQEFSSIDELNAEDRELAQAAIESMKGSYAPYSHFNVGAAVRMSGGQIVRGANQENAAFPSGLCAERTAMFAAGAKYTDKDMLSLAVAGGVYGRITDDPATPCGACRQVMGEFKINRIIMANLKGDKKVVTLEEVLPFAFSEKDL